MLLPALSRVQALLSVDGVGCVMKPGMEDGDIIQLKLSVRIPFSVH